MSVENSLRAGRRSGSRRRAAAGRLLVASAAAVMASPKVRAAVYVFDPGGQAPPTSASDGSGNFDPTTGNFYNASGGLIGPFGNTSADTALFGSGGTGGTVTVGSVTAGAVQFNAVTGSYVLNGGTIALGATGAPGVISLNVASGALTPTLNSVLTGTAGLNVQGNNVQNSSQGLSVLTLGDGNTYAGVTNLSGGVAVRVTTLPTNTGPTGVASGLGQSTGIVLNGTVANANAYTTAAFANSASTLANQGAELIYAGGTTTTSATMGLTLAGSSLDTINVSNPSAVLSYAGPVTVSAAGAVGALSKQGAGTLAFTNPTNTFNLLFVNNGTVTLGTGTGAAQTDTFNNTGNNLIVGANNLTPAGASPASPNVSTLNILAGATVNDVGQGLSLGNSGLTASASAVNNQLFVLNVAGTLTNNNTLSDFSGAIGTGDVAVINVTAGGVVTAPNVKFNTAALTATSTNTGTTVLNVSGGTFNVTAPTGSASDSLVRQAGGPVYVNLSGTTGQINSGQTLYVTNTAAFNASVAAVSFINQSGGTFGVAGNLGFGTGVGTYNLSGGTLLVNGVITAGTPAAGSGFVFNGGTLQANASTGAFFAVPSTAGMLGAQIGAGGGTINTQAFNVATAQAFTTGVAGGTDGGLTKTGSGTLTLTGASTFTGATNIAGGKLAVNGSLAGPVMVGAGTLDGTGRVGPVTVGAGVGAAVSNGNGSTGTLTMNALTFLGMATDNVSISAATPATPGQVVTNALTTPAAGAVTLNVSAGTLSVGTYDLIQYGTLAGAGLAGFTLGQVTLGNGQTATLGTATVGGLNDIVLIVSGSVDQFTGANGNDFSTSGTANFRSTAGGAAVSFTNGDAVLFDDTANAGSTALNLGSAVSPSSTTFNNSSLAYSVSSTGGFGIGGTGGLVKNGTAALTVNTSNTYAGGTTLNAGTLTLAVGGAAGTGGTTVNAGTLNLGAANALATGTTLTVNGGTIDNTSGAPLTLGGSALAINGSFTFAGSGPLNTGTGPVTLANNPTVTVAAGALTVPVGLTGASSLTVTTGAGAALVLTGQSSFTGGTTVNAGTLNLSEGSSIAAVRGPLTINAGGTVNATVTDALGFNAGTVVTTLTVNAGGTFVLGAGNEGYLTNLVVNGGTVSATNGGGFNFNTGFNLSSGASATTGTVASGVVIRGTSLNVTTAAGTTPSGIDLAVTGPISGGAAAVLNASGPGTLYLGGTNTYGGGTNVNGGTVVAATAAAFGPASNTSGVSLMGGARLVLGSLAAPTATVALPQRLTFSGGGTLQLAPTPNFSSGSVTGVTVNGPGVVALTVGANPAAGVTHGLLTTGSVTFANAASGSLDVGRNDLDVTGQTLATVTANVASAFAGGAWNGPGIASSAAAADAAHLTALGVIANDNGAGPLFGGGTADSPTFDGSNPGDADVLVKYTYYGDTNLDGAVNAADYTRIDAGAFNHLTGWFNGDFNYDGVVDGSDYALMDNAFNQQNGVIPSVVVAAPAAALAGGAAAVPEPTTMALAAVGAAGLLGGRRRRHLPSR